MFRTPKLANHASPARRVLWWRTCSACKSQFKWECSWKGKWCLDKPPWRWVRRYVCNRCAEVPAMASIHFGLYRPPKPSGPAPPAQPHNHIKKAVDRG